MSRANVYELLERIEQLPSRDRALLDDLLAEREEQEWRKEATEARRKAREQGIDQEAIDEAVSAVRYGG
jgi:hypothetical protein